MCDQCEQLTINSVVTHEIGCPNAREDYAVRDGCQWCGSELSQETGYYYNGQMAFCDENCNGCYYY